MFKIELPNTTLSRNIQPNEAIQLSKPVAEGNYILPQISSLTTYSLTTNDFVPIPKIDLDWASYNSLVNQSQWSVHVAIISMVLFASIYWLFSKYRLKWPLICTVGLDTTCVWSFFFCVMRNYSDSRFTASTAALTYQGLTLVFIGFLVLREAFYFALLPLDSIGDLKRSAFPLVMCLTHILTPCIFPHHILPLFIFTFIHTVLYLPYFVM